MEREVTQIMVSSTIRYLEASLQGVLFCDGIHSFMDDSTKSIAPQPDSFKKRVLAGNFALFLPGPRAGHWVLDSWEDQTVPWLFLHDSDPFLAGCKNIVYFDPVFKVDIRAL